MKKLVLVAALIAAAGCAPPPAESPADRAISHWVGLPVAAVIGAWGPPSEEKVEDGRHLYIWEATQYDRSYYPANLPQDTYSPYPGGQEDLACRGVIEADGQGRVVAADWQGYECHHLP